MRDSRAPAIGVRGRVFAVFDSDADAEQARSALAAAGTRDDRVVVLAGDAGAAVFDASGRRYGLLGQLTRLGQFTLADQMPDFAWYEAALREGRIVVGVKATGDADVRQAVELLSAAGGHFINRFGAFVTEEFARWRGPEPSVPEFLRR